LALLLGLFSTIQYLRHQEAHEEALALLTCPKKLVIVPGATHLFEEPGTLEQVADLAKRWFLRHLRRIDD
jgi:hypothetical protein